MNHEERMKKLEALSKELVLVTGFKHRMEARAELMASLVTIDAPSDLIEEARLNTVYACEAWLDAFAKYRRRYKELVK